MSAVAAATAPAPTDLSALRVVVVGSGFAGLGAAVRLKQSGVRDLVILERGTSVGGTWRDNTYPGAACDIPSHLYSFSFAPKHDWSRRYAPQHEIRDYLEDCAERFGLRPHLRLGRNVVEARYDESNATWTVTTDTGEAFVADVLVAGVGALREPAYPIDDRSRFRGLQMHSARWDHDADLAGKRVAVIGTGASAAQVVPEMAKIAARVDVVQRTPAWVMPRGDRAYTRLERWLFRRVPFARRLHRAYIYARLEGRFVFFGRSVTLNRVAAQRGRLHLRQQVTDPHVRAQLTPEYRVGCKRIVVSDDYLSSFNKANVSLHTAGIARVTPTGVVTDTGEAVDVDAIIWATGFSVRDMFAGMDVVGRGEVRLDDRWDDRASAHLGMTVPDFPNLFMLLGPNSGLGHNSMILMMEAQFSHIVAAVRERVRRGAAALDVRPEALSEFLAGVDSRNTDLVWASGCRSWYVDEHGRNFTLWPGTTAAYRYAASRFDAADYRFVLPDELPKPDDLTVEETPDVAVGSVGRQTA